MRKVVASRTEIAKEFIQLDGRPYGLGNYPPFESIYNKFNKQVLLFAGRQISKSTTKAVSIILDSMTPHWKTLYIAPSMNQRNVFSNTRLGKIMRYSPKIMKLYMSETEKMKDDVGHKMWSNGSEIHLLYADKDPDRVRGVSANKIYYDEVQDIDYDAVIPVINETLSASPYGQRILYGGTPKTMESAIHALWDTSTQTEWLMRCSGCNRYNIAGFKNIGLKGPICASCGKAINVRDGFWHDTQEDVTNADLGMIKGYRLPQMILPLHANNEEKWRELRSKLEGPNAYSESKAKNELFAMSDALGARMITREELLRQCEDRDLDRTDSGDRYLVKVAGVDWSGEGKTAKSMTALWIWGLRASDGKLVCVYYKAFPPGHPIQDIEEIAHIVTGHNCAFVVGDTGGGAHANTIMRNQVGENRVFGIRWGSFAKQLKWDGVNNCYNVDKTSAFDSFFLTIKKDAFKFAKKEEMRRAFDHYLSEYEHVTQNGDGKRIWQRSASKPDDLLHAAVFAWVAFKVWSQDLTFYT